MKEMRKRILNSRYFTVTLKKKIATNKESNM